MSLDDSTATRSNLLAALLRSPAAIGVAREGSDRLLDEALSPDGRTLAVRGDDGNSRVLRRPDPAPNRTAVCDQRRAGLLRCCTRAAPRACLQQRWPHARCRQLRAETAATAELVDVRTHAPVGVLAVSPDAAVTADVAFAPDGRTFATGEPLNGKMHPPPALIVSWDARTGTARAKTGPIAGGRLTGYTRDGRFLLVVSGERRSLLLDARTLKRLRTFPVGGAAALSPSADEAAFGHADGTVTLLDLASGERKQLFGQSSAPIEAISFSRDGKMLASGSGGRQHRPLARAHGTCSRRSTVTPLLSRLRCSALTDGRSTPPATTAVSLPGT